MLARLKETHTRKLANFEVCEHRIWPKAHQRAWHDRGSVADAQAQARSARTLPGHAYLRAAACKDLAVGRR